MATVIILYIYIVLGSGILMVNIYSSMVDARNWGADIPNSIGAARAYFQKKTPADFFKVFGTATHLAGIAAIVMCWHSAAPIKWCLYTAVIMFALVDVFTLLYFIPRNDIMFRKAPLTDQETITGAWKQWNAMNWIRSLIALLGVVAACLLLQMFAYL